MEKYIILLEVSFAIPQTHKMAISTQKIFT